ncbi:MAG TPA: 2-oxoglutarate and iron-dependent oxygenase domain-containing protein [Reyranella sp.]|nr:2-oxoglutarate and iron-dependent oxygenase domain-containing protein [Reyranella sp.]
MVPEAELRRAQRRPTGSRLSDTETIPVIDLDLPVEQAVRQLRFALTEIGFYYIANHGVPKKLIRDTFDAAARFHAQPLDRKMRTRIDRHNVGYLPMKGDTLRTSVVQTVTKPNLNEAFFVARDLPADHPDVIADRRFRSANRWPADLPGFRETVVEYCETMERLVQRLVPLYALTLDLPAAYFDAAFRESQYKLRMTHYPNQPAALDDEFGIAPHTDTSFLTLLAPNDVPGLSIRAQSGKWIDAPPIAGAYIVNGGQLLRRWTNDTLLATPHRAINRSGGERYALAFFCDASIDWPIAAVPTTVGPDKPPKYPTTYYTDYMVEYQKRTYDLLADQQAAE